MPQLNRLEQLLGCWESRFFLYSLIAQYGSLIYAPPGFQQAFPFVGPIKYWPDLRPHLRLIGQGSSTYDYERFTTVSPHVARHDMSLVLFPELLSNWTASSRRIFQMDDGLQTLLSAMSFGDIRWVDILFPFSSFALTLDAPIETPLGNFDMILVSSDSNESSHDGSKPGVTFGLISSDLETFQPLSADEKSALSHLAMKGKRSTMRKITEYEERFPKRGPFLTFHVGPDHLERLRAEEPYSLAPDSAPQLIGESDSKMSQILPIIDESLRLVAGFCLYLMSLRRGSSQRSEWQHPPTRGKPDPKAITNDAQICQVTTSHVLSQELRDAFRGKPRGPGEERAAGVCRGHYRRWPGTGDDPFAPRIVPVPPYKFRQDRLQYGELLGGSVMRVSA